MSLESIIRRIIREELSLALSTLREGHAAGQPLRGPAPRQPTPETRDAIEQFLATIPAGEQVQASDLFARWGAWAREEAPEWAGITSTAFGRLAVRSSLVERHGVGRRWYVRKGGAGLAGVAPGPGLEDAGCLELAGAT